MPDYPRCKTCRWWEDNDMYGNGVSYCTSPANRRDSPYRPDGACSMGEQGKEDILTGPDFGCVHHEWKEEDS